MTPLSLLAGMTVAYIWLKTYASDITSIIALNGINAYSYKPTGTSSFVDHQPYKLEKETRFIIEPK